jgi:CrcB protein
MMKEWNQALMVGAGGFFGTIIRYAFYRMQSAGMGNVFPTATLLVNVLGCFFIGCFYSWAEKSELLGSPFYLLIAVGFLGGFTTFSAFGLDTFQLFKHGHSGLALLNISLQLFLGLGAVYLGRQCFGA